MQGTLAKKNKFLINSFSLWIQDIFTKITHINTFETKGNLNFLYLCKKNSLT
jgi:hypothetical protein